MKFIMNEEYDFVPQEEPQQLDGATVKPGLHKHGYYISLSEKEQGVLMANGYKLITNMWYSPGDFYEILDPKGSIISPIELGKVLMQLGA